MVWTASQTLKDARIRLICTLAGFDDTIEIMPSVARPRKLVIKGSDGQTYRFLCKPQDDLRKDARLMECTNLMNRLLQKDAASRKRSLRKRNTVIAWCSLTQSTDIRTYAVVPLDEKTGLIEWVPETTGLRAILTKLYAPKGIQPWVSKIDFRLPLSSSSWLQE